MSNSFDQPGYLGKKLQDVLTLAMQQMAEVHRSRGLVMPVEGSSTLHALSPGSFKSLADLARELGQSHQLIAQRIAKLEAKGLAIKTPDPMDRRRNEYHLTPAGEKQWTILDEMMRDVARVNQQIYEEIGHDLDAALTAMLAAIRRKSFAERFQDTPQI